MNARQKAALERRITVAQEQQAHWLKRLADHPTATAHARGVWRARLIRWQHEEQAARDRLNAA
jgi:hypothetical protein